LEWFGEDVSPHRFSRAVTKLKFTTVVKMTDEKILGFDMFSTFGAGDISILGEGKCAHVVLIHYIGVNLISLGLEELSGP
jgi:hypothetical protein